MSCCPYHAQQMYYGQSDRRSIQRQFPGMMSWDDVPASALSANQAQYYGNANQAQYYGNAPNSRAVSMAKTAQREKERRDKAYFGKFGSYGNNANYSYGGDMSYYGNSAYDGQDWNIGKTIKAKAQAARASVKEAAANSKSFQDMKAQASGAFNQAKEMAGGALKQAQETAGSAFSQAQAQMQKACPGGTCPAPPRMQNACPGGVCPAPPTANMGYYPNSAGYYTDY